MAKRSYQPRFYRDTCPSQTAMDTETFIGQLKVICTPDAFFEPTGNIEELLGWIVDHGAEVVWFWNLRFDSDVILRQVFKAVDIMHDREAKLRFLKKHKVEVGDYTVTLIGAKSFRVERRNSEGKARVDCFDAAAFYTKGERRQTLDEAGKTMLGEGKIAEQLGIDRKLIGTVPGYYEEHRERIIEYCKQDAKLTQELGELLVVTAHEALKVYPRRWSSAASLAKAWLELNHPEIIRRNKKVDSYFRPSFRGGIFVTRVLGRIKKLTEADITNAYGTALTKLLAIESPEGLKIKHGTSRSSDAVFGAYYIAIEYDGKLPWRLQDVGIRTGQHGGDDPLVHVEKRLAALHEDPAPGEEASEDADDDEEHHGRDDEKVMYPVCEPGLWHSYCATKTELDYFDEEGISYKVLWADELCGVPRGLAFKDFRELVDRVVDLKEKAKTDPRAALLRECFKRVVNSTYGSLAESKHGETPLTTWPLAAEITAACRITIWREWRKIEKSGGLVVSVNTDSVRYVPGSYTIPSGHGKLGEFDDKFVDHTVTHYQSGVAMIEHPPDCKCSDAKEAAQADRLLRADDGLGTRKQYPGETKLRANERLRRPPAPHEEDGLEIHAASCPCKRCGKAPRVLLRKRGMPSLSPADLLKASGTDVEIVSKRPIHAIEGLIQNRMEEVAAIPETEDDIPVDDGTRRRKLSVLSNLVTAVYDTKDLTFPRLNAGPVMGQPIPIDALLERDWVKAAIRERRLIEDEYAEPEMPSR